MIARAARSVFLLSAALGLVLATACQSTPEACTPESAGLGGQRVVTATRRDLPGLDPKGTCQPRVEAIRSDRALRLAYTEVGVKLLDSAGHAATPDAIALPKVDWSKETVVLREATHEQNVSWIVVDGTNVTLGTQGCAGVADLACAVTVFAIQGIVTTASTYACKDVSCGGVPAPGE